MLKGYVLGAFEFSVGPRLCAPLQSLNRATVRDGLFPFVTDAQRVRDERVFTRDGWISASSVLCAKLCS